VRYCSYEARKVVDAIGEYGPEIPDTHYISIEHHVGKWWTGHIIDVIKAIMARGDADKKLEKIEQQGYDYFVKPVVSILSPRSVALRPDQVVLERGWPISVYHMVTSGFARADFGIKELGLIAEIATFISEPLQFTNAKNACGENRSIYYLHGVCRREYQTAQGRIREIQQTHATNEARGWRPPENHEHLDVIERHLAVQDWQERLNNIMIREGLDAKTVP
jgi:hypothetical protein